MSSTMNLRDLYQSSSSIIIDHYLEDHPEKAEHDASVKLSSSDESIASSQEDVEKTLSS